MLGELVGLQLQILTFAWPADLFFGPGVPNRGRLGTFRHLS